MFNDPVADILIQIKNGYLTRKSSVTVPFSKIKERLVSLLYKNGYIGNFLTKGSGYKKQLVINLKYPDQKPVLTNVIRISKPGLRIYVNRKNIPAVFGGLGITLISTAKGLMTGGEARRQNLGGELICKIW